jgi:hypothetical protein
MARPATAVATLAFVAAAITSAHAAGVTEAWRASGFQSPESVSWDAAAQVFYVSNIGNNDTPKDGDGFISKLDANGNVIALKWVTGLDAPKGTDVAGGKLYVSDIDQLVEIDTARGEITGRYPADGAKFLNDVTIADDGRVFVADTFASAIYVLADGKMSVFVQDPKLRGPNGLTTLDGKLLVAELGDVSKGFANMTPGNVKAIDLASKAISDFGPATVGNLDGIERDGSGGVTVTDNPKGMLLDIKPGAEPIEVGMASPGAADHEYAANLGLYVVPQMRDNAIVAYKPNP